jgi:hypothetical protein
MHRHVDLARYEGALDVLDEDPLATDVVEGDIVTCVTLGADDPRLDLEVAVGDGKGIEHKLGLGDSETASAGADDDLSHSYRL